MKLVARAESAVGAVGACVAIVITAARPDADLTFQACWVGAVCAHNVGDECAFNVMRQDRYHPRMALETAIVQQRIGHAFARRPRQSDAGMMQRHVRYASRNRVAKKGRRCRQLQ